MKKLWFCVAILILILTLGITEQVFISSTFKQLDHDTSQILSDLLSEDYPTALARTNALQNLWNKKRDILEFLCPNADIKDIAKELGELSGAQHSLQYADAITRAAVVSAMAKNSANLLAFKWKNIF